MDTFTGSQYSHSHQDRYGNVIDIFPVSKVESDKIALVAVTDRGTRMYYGNNDTMTWSSHEHSPLFKVHTTITYIVVVSQITT